MGRSLLYEMLKGVRPTWLGYFWSSRFLPVCLSWFEGLKLPAWSFLAGRVVTKSYYVMARTSFLSMEYLFARLNRSSIVASSFLERDSKKGVPRQMLLLKIYKMVSMLHDSTWSTTYPNHFTNSLNDSFSCIFMFCMLLMLCLYYVEHR